MTTLRAQQFHPIFHVILLCYAAIIGDGAGTRGNNGDSSSSRRYLQANDHIVDRISHTDVLTSSQALLVYRDEQQQSTTPCNSPSTNWIREQVHTISEEDLTNFFDWKVYTLPFVYKLFVEQKGIYDIEYIGKDGKYTQEITSILERAQSFWSDTGVNDDLRVLGAHGSDLADLHNNLIPSLEALFGASYHLNDDDDDDYTVVDHAMDIQALILRLPGGYDNPLLTFNAFATDDDEDDMTDHPSIIIGDGYFEFQESIGYEVEGPEYALTHEHAHHLQFSLNTPEERSQQSARRQELMADALSAYFLAHARGLDMSTNEITNIRQIAYSAGDCETRNDGHHGTPRQRRCATAWGASLSQEDNYANYNLVELKNRFNSWYENVDYLDESCQHHFIMATSSAFIARHQTVQYILQAVIVVALSFGVAI
ncbi:hypothetical protein ACHAXH_006501 [Discostella pseudostelligera]